MLKKSCVAILVIMLLASLTLGSVTPVSTSGVNARPAFNMPHVEFFGSPGTTVATGTGGAGFTTVILDMSSSQDPVGDTALFMPYHREDMVKYNSNSFIYGKMIVQKPGEMDRSFPVHWARHLPVMLKDGIEYANFEANISIPLSMLNSPGPGMPTAEGLLFFHSMINIANPVISGSLPVTAVTDNSGYTDQIGEGQTVWHQADITGSSTTVSVDLKWQDSNDDLRLMIYTPDGRVLGPYYDSSDNADDGEINLKVSNPDGVAAGAWSFKVTGVTVSGKDDYYLRTW